MGNTTLSKKCNYCSYEVKIAATNEQLAQLENGAHIQNVFPQVAPGDRELFISGMCGKCFDSMFE